MSSVIVGKSRMGKTTGVIRELMATKGMEAQVVADPQDSLSELYIRWLVREQKLDNVLFDRFSSKKCLGFDLLGDGVDQHLARIKRWDSMNLMCRLRGINIHEAPLIREFIDLGLMALQEVQKPFFWLMFCFKPHHAAFQQIRKGLKDPELKKNFEIISRFSVHQIRRELSPALRLCEPFCTSDLIQRRTIPSFDFWDFLEKKGCLIVQGKSRYSDEEVAFMLGAINALTIQYVKYRENGHR